MVGATVLWGVGNVFVKEANLQGITFAMYRLWGGSLVFAIALLLTRRRLTSVDIRASLIGGVAFGTYMALLYTALKATSIADVTIIGALQPILVLMVAGRLFGERVTRRDGVLAAVAMLGVLVVVLGSAETPSWSLRGDAFALCALFAFTAFWLASKQARTGHAVDPLVYVATASLIGSVIVTPVALLAAPAALPAGQDWLWLGLTVLLPGALAHWLAAWGHRFVAVWRSSLIQLGVPVVSVAAAWAWLGERLRPVAGFGGVIVLVSLGAVIAGTARKPREAELPAEDQVV
jgi:probable blue pigment (indigoidine) exporter